MEDDPSSTPTQAKESCWFNQLVWNILGAQTVNWLLPCGAQRGEA